MNKTLKKILIAVGVVAVFVGVSVLLSMRKTKDFHEKYEGADLTEEVSIAEKTGTYEKYLAKYPDAKECDKEVEIDLFDYEAEGNVKVETNYQGESKVLFTVRSGQTDTHLFPPLQSASEYHLRVPR